MIYLSFPGTEIHVVTEFKSYFPKQNEHFFFQYSIMVLLSICKINKARFSTHFSIWDIAHFKFRKMNSMDNGHQPASWDSYT